MTQAGRDRALAAPAHAEQIFLHSPLDTRESKLTLVKDKDAITKHSTTKGEPVANLPDLWRTNLAREFDQFFDRFNGLPAGRRYDADISAYGFNPSCEVEEDKLAYHLKFDLPGVPKDQIKIDLHENRLTGSGERKSEKKEDGKKQHFTEVFYGAFSRSMTFPTPIDAEKVAAKFENGVLNINVPKSDASLARQVTIK